MWITESRDRLESIVTFLPNVFDVMWLYRAEERTATHVTTPRMYVERWPIGVGNKILLLLYSDKNRVQATLPHEKWRPPTFSKVSTTGSMKLSLSWQNLNWGNSE